MFKVVYEFIVDTPPIDIFAVITGIIYVILAAKNDIRCWIFGFANAILTMYSVFYNLNLYMETFLYGFYAVAAIYGWYNWKNQQKTNSKVKILRPKSHITLIITGTVLTFIFGYFFDKYTEAAATYADAFTTIFALMTTVMVANRILENWLYWIAIDSVSIYLYSSRGGEFYVILFSVYIFVSILGFIKWSKEYQKQSLSE
jgi:nicotinamide mononucleotide transporter